MATHFPNMQVLVFDSAASRDASLPHPRYGQPCFITNNATFLIYNGPVVGWTPPWNTAWGSIVYSKAFAQIPAVPTLGTLADFSQGLSVQFNAVPNRIYEVRFQAWCTSNADGDVLEVRANWFPGTGKHNWTPWNGSPSFGVFKKVDLTGVAHCHVFAKRRYGSNLIAGTIPTGSGQFILALGQLSGSAGVMECTTDCDSFIEVFDIGSAGAPPTTS